VTSGYPRLVSDLAAAVTLVVAAGRWRPPTLTALKDR